MRSSSTVPPICSRGSGSCGDRSTYIDAAVRTFSRLVDINPNHADAWNSLGICMKELGKDATAHASILTGQMVLSGRTRHGKKVRNLDLLV